MWEEIQRQAKEQAVVSFIHVLKEVKKKEKDEIEHAYLLVLNAPIQ